MTNTYRQTAFERIDTERKRQDAKWGIPNHDDFVWLAILTEEIGEVAQASLYAMTETRQANLKNELVQVAAVAVAWLECIEQAAARAAETEKD